MTKAYSLRRVKDSYLSIKKIERTIPVVLFHDEKQRYQAIQSKFAIMAFSDTQKASQVILKGILGLRQICSHGSVIMQSESALGEPVTAGIFQADIGNGTNFQSEACWWQPDPSATDCFGESSYSPERLPLSYQGWSNLSSVRRTEGSPCGLETYDQTCETDLIAESHVSHYMSSKLKKVVSSLIHWTRFLR